MRAMRAIPSGAALAAALILCLATPARAAKAPADLLGLTPGMTDLEARQTLERIGEVVRGEDRLKQTWKLRDPRYGFLVIRYDQDWRVHWVTAFAREGGKPVRYRDVGDLALADRSGDHFYTWTFSDRSGGGPWTVVARGTDPRYLDSISIQASPMRQALTAQPRAESGARTE